MITNASGEQDKWRLLAFVFEGMQNDFMCAELDQLEEEENWLGPPPVYITFLFSYERFQFSFWFALCVFIFRRHAELVCVMYVDPNLLGLILTRFNSNR